MTSNHILLTNDDGIQSPGLWTAAKALSELGFVHVVAPREQYSGAGRSMPVTSDGVIHERTLHVNGKDWPVFAVGGTPAQAVLHAILEILPEMPILAVSGINYGENLGSGITISGTVGAALEASALGIPALAVSLETGREYHLSYSNDIDFSAAGFFTSYFGRMLLERKLPADVNVLKVDVPSDATPETPWQISRLATIPYFEPLRPERESMDQPVKLDYRAMNDPSINPPDTDVYVLRVARKVSVTPISLDLTSRVKLDDVEQYLRGKLT
jgi:5'-nucleotidase